MQWVKGIATVDEGCTSNGYVEQYVPSHLYRRWQGARGSGGVLAGGTGSREELDARDSMKFQDAAVVKYNKARLSFLYQERKGDETYW